MNAVFNIRDNSFGMARGKARLKCCIEEGWISVHLRQESIDDSNSAGFCFEDPD